MTQPKLLAVDLFSKGLISEAVKDSVTTITHADNADKAITLMNAVGARLNTDLRPAQVMKKFYEVMETEASLQPVCCSIRAALGEFWNTCISFMIYM